MAGLGCQKSSPLFPGSFAGASLKLGDSAPWWDYGALFPGSFAGASLKHHEIKRAPMQELTAIPRLFCRGLIEAPASPTPSPPTPRLFPGSFAGASLKPHPGKDADAVFGAAIPRLFCRGLIEASQGAAQMTPTTALFPGSFAGASLKLVQRIGGIVDARICYSPALLPGPH